MKKKIASVIGLILLLSSCGKTHTYEYEIVVKNDTNYLLEEVIFGFQDDNKIITILPNDKTHTFSLSYTKENISLYSHGSGPGTISCGIKTWSNSIDVFTSTEDFPICLSSSLSTAETNYFTIKLISDTTDGYGLFETTQDSIYDNYNN